MPILVAARSSRGPQPSLATAVNSLNFRMISEKISRYSAFEEDMTWTTPDLIEISIGLGIDGYFRPSSDL